MQNDNVVRVFHVTDEMEALGFILRSIYVCAELECWPGDGYRSKVKAAFASHPSAVKAQGAQRPPGSLSYFVSF